MKRDFYSTVLAIAISALATSFNARAAAQAGPAGDTTAAIEVSGGTASFDADTSISAINVHGKSTNLQGRATIRQSGAAITIEHMEATLPVKTITTGLGLRDEHMRKYVFTTDDGQIPDLKFVADKADCTAAQAGSAESLCNLSGRLAIRGTPRPFAIALKVNKTGGAYRAAGTGTVKLSTYGIPRPSQFGVTTTDEVKLHLEFTAKPSPGQVASRTGATR